MLGLEERGLGSGPLESQLAVSRNGLDWKRYPAPAYVGIGRHQGRDVVTAYIGHGMIRRGEELWQYYFGETQYHSAITKDPDGRGVYRLVQRLDGFVSLDSPLRPRDDRHHASRSPSPATGSNSTSTPTPSATCRSASWTSRDNPSRATPWTTASTSTATSSPRKSTGSRPAPICPR